MEIDEIFEGEWQLSGEFLIRCPVCGDHSTHGHCHINLTKGVFYCFYKGCKGTLIDLVQEYGEGVEIELRENVIEKEKYSEINFFQFKKVTGLIDANDRLAMSYLKSRGLNKDEVELYDIRYCPDSFNRYYGRIIFPIFENEQIVCFLARSFLGFIKPKYLFPRVGETKCTAGEVIFGYERFKNSKSRIAVLVEGIFDGIGINQKNEIQMHGLALLSKNMTESQLEKLLKLDAEFYVMLDADAKKESLKIGERLFCRGCRIYIAFLNYGDPALVSQEEFDRAIKKAEDYGQLDKVLEMEMKIGEKRF